MRVAAIYGLDTVISPHGDFQIIDCPDFPELADNLEEKGWKDIDELYIVAHTSGYGRFRLNVDISKDNIESRRSDLERMGRRLKPRARIIFYSCGPGKGWLGDVLMMRLSKIWSAHELIMFVIVLELVGEPGKPNATRVAGIQRDQGGLERDDIWSEYAKWAKDGAIIRPALEEYTSFARFDPDGRNRCGSDNCLGHKTMGLNQFCNPYRRTSWPRWVLTEEEQLKRNKAAATLKNNSNHRPLGSDHPAATHSHKHSKEAIHPQAPAYPHGSGYFTTPNRHGK